MAIDNKDKKVLNVPHLRFPEFSGEWDSERLENLTVSIGDGLHSTPVYCEQGDYCFINGNNIIDGKVSINEKTLRVTKEEAYKYNAALLKVDTILMSINGTIGNVALYNGENIMLGKSACYINPSSRIVREYLFHILSSPRIQAYFQGEVTGTTIKNLSLRTIRGSKILLPSNEEQKKIARLFSLVDERIATQNKIIEKLESLIKGIAQNVARNNKPNIRLSECLEYSSSTLQESDVCENGTYPVYGANGIVGYIDNYNTEKEAVYIIKDGSGVGTVSYVTGKCSATGTLNTLQAKEGYSLQYLYYMLKVFNFEPYKTGMAIPHIYFKDYGKAKIFCPSYTEQLKYVELLSAIDNKLSAEQSILTDLSLQKQYLLSQMFI
ncbi:restriction endonuclease subunit S [Bacteroides uniformis]|uniref:restriction endonuclease subunit S n=1 Tax=Bacteroides uniformis TaxID=820 RepID=UPI0039B588A4